MNIDENGVTPILFVRGFATDISTGVDDYLHLKLFIDGILDNKNINQRPAGRYKVVYFNYGLDDNINEVYERLCRESNQYDILIGHSLGGGLLAKYRNNYLQDKKIILLMPLLFRNDNFNLISHFLFKPSLLLNPKLVFIKALFAPAQYIFEGGNLLNCDFSLISFKQMYDFYKEFKENNLESEYLEFLKCSENVTIFYANGELLNAIDENTLSKIPNKNLIRVEGLHECWRSTNLNTIDFFTKLEKVIKEDIIKREEPPFVSK